MDSPAIPPNSLTRRSFCKKSALTISAASLLARGISLGQGGGALPSCPILVNADPDQGYFESDVIAWDDGQMELRAKLIGGTVNPGGPKEEKGVWIKMLIWENGYTWTSSTPQVSVWGKRKHGDVVHRGCVLDGTVNLFSSTSSPERAEVHFVWNEVYWEGSAHAPPHYEYKYNLYFGVMEVTDHDLDNHEAFIEVVIYFYRERHHVMRVNSGSGWVEVPGTDWINYTDSIDTRHGLSPAIIEFRTIKVFRVP